MIYADEDEVYVRGKRIGGADARRCVAFHKPKGLLTSLLEQQGGKRTIGAALRGVFDEAVRSIGRLDRLTSGLLLLTNDGELTFEVTRKRNRVPKEYVLTVAGQLKPDDDRLAALLRGVEL